MTVAASVREASWSPLGFIRGREQDSADHLRAELARDVTGGRLRVIGDAARWYVRELAWDSAHFGMPVHRIEFADWDPELAEPRRALAHSLDELRSAFPRERAYVFGEVPVDDLPAVQAFGLAGLPLIETRATYYLADPDGFESHETYQVRQATDEDIPGLREVAAGARNPLDRYHADADFSGDMADRYLATYVEQSVRGFADFVLVPDPGDGRPPGAFFTATLTRTTPCPVGADHGCAPAPSVGRIVLVAIGPERRGWHRRLLTEATRRFKQEGMEMACMTTQIGNRAVVRNSERLGYRLGRVTHVFATARVDA